MTLALAIALGGADDVEKLLRAGANPDEWNGPSSVLSMAVRRADMRKVELLLAFGAQVNVTSSVGNSPLCDAVAVGWADGVRRLLRAGASLNGQCDCGPALSVSIVYHEMEILRELLAAGADPNVINAEGFAPLMLAAGNENARAIVPLVAAGADLEVRDRAGLTAYLHAAVAGDEHAGRLLLLAGADHDARDPAGLGAKEIAMGCGHDWPSVDELLR